MTETEVIQIIIYALSWTIYHVYENHFCKVKGKGLIFAFLKSFLKQNVRNQNQKILILHTEAAVWKNDASLNVSSFFILTFRHLERKVIENYRETNFLKLLSNAKWGGLLSSIDRLVLLYSTQFHRTWPLNFKNCFQKLKNSSKNRLSSSHHRTSIHINIYPSTRL